MPQPQKYERREDFTDRDGDDTNHAALNDELDAAALSINQLRDNLALIQSDDGDLKRGIVKAENLADSAFDAVLGNVAGVAAEANAAADRSTLLATQAEAERQAAEAARNAAQGSQAAAANSATAASNSQTAAANSASAAATSATNSANSATASASSAAASAASATNSANGATASQTARTGSETARDAAIAARDAAQASQTAAATSATSAAASAASANQSKLDTEQIAKRYQGDKASAPTLRNDGTALQAGDLYFDTTLNDLRVYDGAAVWKSAGSTVNGTTVRQTFTATAGQTSFTVTGGYDGGFADVFLNGVKLVNGTEVNVSSGTNVVLAAGAAAGDTVDVIAYGAFLLANHYTKAQMDAELALKANQATTYTKAEVDTGLALKLNAANPSYTGALTGGTGVINIGSGQFVKDASGNVGIGTSSPGHKLDVQGIAAFVSPNLGTTGAIRIKDALGNPDAAYIQFVNNAVSSQYAYIQGLAAGGLNFNGAAQIATNGQQSSTIPGGSPTLFPEFKCRAWVNFNGTTSPGTIRASGNVSSVTRGATGFYTVNFTTAMPDNSFAAFGGCANTSSGKAVVTAFSHSTTAVAITTSAGLAGSGLEDSSLVSISVFR